MQRAPKVESAEATAFRRRHLWMFSETLRHRQYTARQYGSEESAAEAWHSWEEKVETLLSAATCSSWFEVEKVTKSEAEELLSAYTQKYSEIQKMCQQEARKRASNGSVAARSFDAPLIVTYSLGKPIVDPSLCVEILNTS